MDRVQLLGPRDLLQEAIAFLQERGVLELRAPVQDTGAPFVRPPEPAPGQVDREERLEEVVRRIDALRARLPPASGRASRAEGDVPDPGTIPFLGWLARREEELTALEARREELLGEREATTRFSRIVVALAPFRHGIDPSLHPEYHGLVLRNEPDAPGLLRAEVQRITGGACEVAARRFDDESIAVLIAVPRAHGREISSLLFDRGVEEVRLPPAYSGKPLVEVLLLLAARERSIPGEVEEVESALAGAAGELGPALARAASEARAELERLRARVRCGETRFAFVVTGYVPSERVPGLRAAAVERLGARVSVLSNPPPREGWQDVPVVLRNRPWVRPFERLLALVPLPRYGSIDPTPWLAVFFPLFFGLVLGDLVFGLIGLGGALFVRSRGWGGRTGRDLAAVAIACSLAALLFGVLYGEALGELGERAGLHPVLLDRRRALHAFLAVAVAVGAVHVGAGMALGVVGSLRAGRVGQAVARAAKLLLLLAASAAAASLVGLLPRGVLRPVLLAGLGFLAVAVVAGGPLAALELVLGLGNVLSYARLMALGLASAMLAEVANLVAATLRPAVAGVGLAILLHAVNFTLGLIGPTVAALRLHYVEFFEKFYDEGGAPYRPFAFEG